MKLPAEPKPEQVVCVIDTREQTPLDLAPLRVERGTLQTGDYSVKGLTHLIAIERKELSDALSCVGQQRDRFQRELDRLRAYPHRGLVIEATWEQIQAGEWRSKVTPQSVTGSLLAWSLEGLPVWFAKDHHEAGRIVSRLLFLAARRYWRSVRSFMDVATAQRDMA